jgi:hypothetical protein
MIRSRRHLPEGFCMPAPLSVRVVRGAAALAIAGAMAVVTGWSVAAEPTEGPDPTGGLRSRGMVPGVKGSTPGASREELVRQWDLDGNGTIDASEASIARARMRRSRLESELEGGIDPVTGKPRVIAGSEPADEPPLPDANKQPDMPAEPRKRASDKPALPGTRVPDAKPVVSGSLTPTVPKSPSQTAGDAESRGKTLRIPTAPSRPGSVTGGVRAGAPAARPGYGSLSPKPDLNAGIPVPDTSRRAGGPRGGLLPSARGPLAPRPATPAAPTPRPPRVSADDIGGF